VPAATLTREELDEFYHHEKDRLALQRRAEDLGAANKSLRERILEYVREHGGRDRTTVCHGYVLAIKTRSGFPAYKEAYLKLAGPDAVEELRKQTPPTESLSMEPAA